MENAAEALKMGAWVLILVVALSIIMSAFSQARQTIDAQVAAADREYLTEYLPENKEYERIVGIDSIIPTIYRAFKENYQVVFPDSVVLYRDKELNKNINYIDIGVKKVIGSDLDEFIKRILYGGPTNDEFANKYKIEFKSQGLINQISSKAYREKMGIYYEDEVNGGTSTPTANKVEKRVFTYEEY